VKTSNKIIEQVDEQLVALAQQGDKQAYNLLVLKYQHKIIHLVNRYINDASEAQDIAQDTFIKAYRDLGNFRGDARFYTWLYRIAINTTKNYLVSRYKKNIADAISDEDAEIYAANQQWQTFNTPEQQVLNQEILDAIYLAIELLPEDMRMAITLREFEGMSYEEIAQIMKCPSGTVRSRIFRAREAIDNKIKPLLDHREF
jgi:RNA polymerase sigma-70 factor (ECF subfamily)